jgi:PII-like signaling protein
MDGFKQGRLLRIFVDETDRHGIEPMYTAVVQLLRSKHMAGATVFRGIEGFGQHQEVHLAKLFSWLPNLPILIEVVDDAEKIEAILPELESFVGEGLITLEAAEYLKLSRPGRGKASQHAHTVP